MDTRARLAAVVALGILAGGLVGLAAASPAPYEAPLADGDAIAATHAAELEAAGNFTSRATTRISVNGSLQVNRTTVARLNTDASTALVDRYSDRVGRITVYGDGAGGTYERQAPTRGPVRFGQPLASATMPSQYRRPGIAPLLGDVDYSYRGVTRVDGVRVHEYAATSPGQLDGIIGQDETGSAVTSTVDVRVFITPEGVVRELTLLVEQRGTDRTRTLNSSLRFSAVGQTTVPEPDWLPTARQRVGPPR